MSYEYEIDDVDYDTGYGEYNGTLVVECEPIIEDCRFDAHNGMGALQSYGDANAITGVKVLGATLFLVGNNGQELGDVEFEDDESLDNFKWLEEYLIDKLTQES